MRCLGIVALVLLLPLPAAAQTGMAAPPPTKPTVPTKPTTPTLKPGWEPKVGAQVELGGKKKLYVGDTFKIKVTVIHRAGVQVNLPTSLILGDISEDGRDQGSREKLDGEKVKVVFTLTVSAFNVGEVTIPAIPITFTPPHDAFNGPDRSKPAPALTVTTKPLRQRISSVLANEPNPQLKKNARSVRVMVEDKTKNIALLVVLGILAGGALGFLLLYFLLTRKRKPKPAPPPRPAHEVALEKLNQLARAGHLERGEFKEFYLGVSEAIREYLGNRYGFDSLELTTTELMSEMHQAPMIEYSKDDLQTWLLDCDLVKFARYVPPLQDAQKTMEVAFHIVEVTRFIPRPDEEEDEDRPPGSHPPPPQPGGRAPTEAPRV